MTNTMTAVQGAIKAAAMKPTTGVAVSAGTVASDVVTRFGCIPADIGKLASLVGLLLSLILIVTHLWKFCLERKKLLAEIKKDK